MAERHSGFVNQVDGIGGVVNVEDHRLAQSALWTPDSDITSRSGLVPTGWTPGWVSATSPTPDGRVHVAPFRYVMQSGRGGGVYTLTLDAIKDIDVIGDQAADPSNPRYDLIVAHQYDTYFADANSDMVVEHIIGTPGVSPVDPQITGSSDYVIFARVVVGPNATNIDDSDIANFNLPWTVATGGTVPVRTQVERDALVPWEGMRCYRVDKGWSEEYIAGAWRLLGIPLVSTLTDVTNPYAQQVVRYTGDGRLYTYTGSAWATLNNPGLPAGVLTDTVDRSYAGSTASWIGLATVTEQSTIAGNTMVDPGTGGTSLANAPSITILEAGLYTVGLRCTFATDGSNGTPVKVIGVTVNSTSATITRANCLTSANAPTEGSDTQSEGQGVTAMAEERFGVGDVLRPVMVASGATWINSGSATFAQGGRARFWAHKIKD